MLTKREMETQSLNVGPRRPLVTPRGEQSCTVVWAEARKQESEEELREKEENEAKLR